LLQLSTCETTNLKLSPVQSPVVYIGELYVGNDH